LAYTGIFRPCCVLLRAAAAALLGVSFPRVARVQPLADAYGLARRLLRDAGTSDVSDNVASCSTGRGPTALPALNCHRWSCSNNFRHSCPCRVPTWCAMPAVWRRIASSGRRLFRHRHSKASTASKRRREPRMGTGQGCSAMFLLWIWRPARFAVVAPCALLWPFFRHCVGGGKRADTLRRRSRARPCDLHPGVGDYPHPALPSAFAGRSGGRAELLALRACSGR
jgi:hypothetical protein